MVIMMMMMMMRTPSRYVYGYVVGDDGPVVFDGQGGFYVVLILKYIHIRLGWQDSLGTYVGRQLLPRYTT